MFVREIWGPSWPTRPVFEAVDGNSSEHPSHIPFVVLNESSLFHMKDAQLWCRQSKYVEIQGSWVGVDQYGPSQVGKGNIRPKSQKLMACKPLTNNYDDDPIYTADLELRYRVSPWPWNLLIETEQIHFIWADRLDPPRWIESDEFP